MKVMMVAGEASGDLHGANVARQLRLLDPKVRLFGMGGAMMREAGVRLLYDPTGISVMGFAEVLKSLALLWRVRARLVEILDRQRPDVLVVIDFPGFNMRLAEQAHRRGIPVVYFIPPAAWAWGRGRAAKVAAVADCVCSVFPFEAQVYQQASARVCYVGHPLLDVVRQQTPRHDLLAEIGLDPNRPMFALLPGSRRQEVRQLLPMMAEAASLIAAAIPEAQFAVPVAHTLPRSLLAEMLAEAGLSSVALVNRRTHDVLAAAEVAIIASGTATLEAAILGTPMVMVYKVARSTYHILRRLVKVSLFALPNIVLNRRVVPELLQDEATSQRVAAEVIDLWQHPHKRQQMQRELAEVVTRLGSSGAGERTAKAILAVGRGEDPAEFALPMPSAGA